MQCTKCKSEILATDKFCPECGNTVNTQGKTCSNPKCKRSGLPDEAVYCPDCGTKCNTTLTTINLDKTKEQLNSNVQINNARKNIQKGPETHLPLASSNLVEKEGKKKKRIPVAVIIGILASIIIVIFIIHQFIIGKKYDRYIRSSTVAIESGDCEYALESYEKANKILDNLIFKEKVDLDTEINECLYETSLNEGEKLLSELSLNTLDVDEVKEKFLKAGEYKKDAILESKIMFCDKLLLALEAQSDEEWVSAFDYYSEVINYARSNDINHPVIAEIKNEKAKILTPKAKILEVTKESNIYEDGKKGMIIHVKFETTFMKDRQGSAVVWFYYEDGEKLMDENDDYCTSGGQVSNDKDFEPRYKESIYNDLKIFMPYRELHLSSGSTDLKLRVGIFCEHEQLAKSDFLSFTMTK